MAEIKNQKTLSIISRAEPELFNIFCADLSRMNCCSEYSSFYDCGSMVIKDIQYPSFSYGTMYKINLSGLSKFNLLQLIYKTLSIIENDCIDILMKLTEINKGDAYLCRRSLNFAGHFEENDLHINGEFRAVVTNAGKEKFKYRLKAAAEKKIPYIN
jgi:hypothetical protein